MVSLDPVEHCVEQVRRFLILHCQLFYLDVCAWLLGDCRLLYKALIKLFDKVVVFLEKFGYFHEGLDGA